MQIMQQRIRNIETWNQEYRTCVSQAINEAQVVFFEERAALLKCILALLTAKISGDKNASQLVKDLLLGGTLETNLVKSLHRNHSLIEVFGGFTCPQRDVNTYLQREELQILSLLAKIYRTFETPKISNLVDYLGYQAKTRFSGLKLRQLAYSTDAVIQAQSQKIQSAAI